MQNSNSAERWSTNDMVWSQDVYDFGQDHENFRAEDFFKNHDLLQSGNCDQAHLYTSPFYRNAAKLYFCGLPYQHKVESAHRQGANYKTPPNWTWNVFLVCAFIRKDTLYLVNLNTRRSSVSPRTKRSKPKEKS